MRTTLLRIANTEFGARSGIKMLAVILIGVGICSMVLAYKTPFWYDEICTVILCRLPSASEIWKALDNAADTNPPLFYLIASMGRQLIQDDHLGYRLPSIIALLGTSLCLYVILSKRVDGLSAAVGATFVLCTPLAGYAFEARPYALMLGFVSAAILAFQRIENSRLYSFALAITLATALSLHYYAILVWPAFVIAEVAAWARSRRFRSGTWIALVLGTAPLLIFADLLLHLRQYYGQNFWARPNLNQIFLAPDYLFNLGCWGSSFTIVAIVALVWWTFGKPATPSFSGQRQLRETLPIEDCALTVMLLLIPVIAVAAAKVSSGVMTLRYMMPTILGGALAVGYLTSKVAQPVKALLLVLMFMSYGLNTHPRIESQMVGAREVKEILTRYNASGLPIVISSGIQYLPNAYYMPPDQNIRLYALVDPPAAVTFAKTDSVDLALSVLRHYFPIKVEDYRKFSSEHREFILISQKRGGGLDWWPARLLQDSHNLSLASVNGDALVYKVILKPPDPLN